jgi:hypothetical protein
VSLVGAAMKTLQTLFEKCTVTVEITGDRCRISGRGLFGIAAVVAIVGTITYFAPQLISLIAVR